MRTVKADFKDLLGKILISMIGAEKESEEIVFKTSEGTVFRMNHEQDCCENVSVEDVCGDIGDVLNNPLLEAEEIISYKNPNGVTKGYQDSFTWTFYKLGTIKGSVTIRWYGESNGYYSERVSFRKEM